MHALCAALRPIYGVLDVLLNDGSLGLFNLIYLPGSDGYTSTIVPIMEAFGLYNIKTQYQYRQDMSKEYDAILLDILNPLLDKVEDILNAPVQTLMSMLPNLSLFFANDGLLQVIETLQLRSEHLLMRSSPSQISTIFSLRQASIFRSFFPATALLAATISSISTILLLRSSRLSAPTTSLAFSIRFSA